MVDKLNDISYAYHYRNLDSTAIYAQKALQLAEDYSAGKAEALNNLAFVSIMRMDYAHAYSLLAEVHRITNNQIELFIADVQQMRLCQRESRNKEFYEHREQALRSQRRIDEEREMLSARENARLLYAQSEFAIVTSTYYYYVGLEQPSIDAMNSIRADELENDTAQYLNYLYNIGAGGIITQGTQEEISHEEFDYLLRCYMLATKGSYPFWEANSMQAISEHLIDAAARRSLIASNLPAIKFINSDEMPDSLLAGYLAQKSLAMFRDFGDVYQTAGAYRTLASCYVAIDDYRSALICLNDALHADTLIEQAPDLVASIHEQLSVAYSAIDDKYHSDHHRNVYLDQQEQTRQDRQLEARAEKLERSSRQLNVMIVAVIFMILAVAALIYIFDRLRRRSDKKNSMEQLLQPLEEWRKKNKQEMQLLSDRYEEVNEHYAINLIHIRKNKRRNLENRAKVFLVNSITPFIDRMIHEVRRLEAHDESPDKRRERYEYMVELTDNINSYNDVLTQWIQLRQGELSLHIESFALQSLFNTVMKSRMAFQLKGIALNVEPTAAWVKADRVLTLFMINTMADNARKFTPKGGSVTISAEETASYVEISIADTGQGMSPEELQSVFSRKVIVDNGQSTAASHGFGLMNCKGIIEKYRKISQIFSVCQITAESQQGEGSRFAFRLPKGMARAIVALCCSLASLTSWAAQTPMMRAAQFADSAYYSNVQGTYALTLQYADSVRHYVNDTYRQLRPESTDTLLPHGSTSAEPPEVRWFHDSVRVNYDVILDIRNETAIAALALHQWPLYRYNNKVYTQLFKELSADASLGAYCRAMQRSESNKTIAVIMLILLLILLFPAYYLLYYRHRLYYRFCLERVERINAILLSADEPRRKLQLIDSLSSDKFPPMLLSVVEQVKQALHESIAVADERQSSIELAEDECRRAEYENEKLHISNSVLDNCLSTLKHETMYYPSRIRQLIDGTDSHLTAISELVVYYKELYSLLSQQSMRQVDAVKYDCRLVPVADVLPHCRSELRLLGDRDMLAWLFELLRQQAATTPLQVEVSATDDQQYAVFRVAMPTLQLSAAECAQLFAPSMAHLPFLLCRQIVRDHSQLTARRGCGMRAEPRPEGGTTIIVTLSKAPDAGT